MPCTAGASAPQFTAVTIGSEFQFFRLSTPTDVIKLVQAVPDKHYSLDPLPTWL